MARDIEGMETYYENVGYGEQSLDSEIHGSKNEEIIRSQVRNVMTLHAAALKAGDKDAASKLEKIVYHIDKEVANGAVNKTEHATSLRSTSNWSDMRFMDKAMTEQGEVGFNEDGKMTFTVLDETKTVAEMSVEFEEIGDWMQPLMILKEKLGKARNNMGNPPPFDINYAVNNLIQRNWKSMIADPDPTLDPNGISKGYRLQSILHDEMDENGVLPKDYNLNKESFNPKYDTRLFANISKELHNTFNGTDGSEGKEKKAGPINEENNAAEGLMNRIKPQQKA